LHLFTRLDLSYCEDVRKLWRNYPSTVLSVLFLVLAGVYGWFDARSQQPILGVTDTRGYEQSVVLEVLDGQTLRLEDGREIRYAGIQVPSSTADSGVGECYAAQALQLSKELVEHKIVFLEKDSVDTDRYGRPLRYVWVQDRLINHELVLQGAAVVYAPDSDFQYLSDLQAAERAARVQLRGLWRECRATSPVQ
jgi:micrococcal nuclease